MSKEGHYMARRTPVLTTTQRDLLIAVEGMIIFNSTTDQLEEYDGSTWEAVGQVIMTTHEADYGLHSKVVRKTADETVTDSTTVQNDDELLLAIGANEVWQFTFWLIVNSPADADFKCTVTGPSGSSIEWGRTGAFLSTPGGTTRGDATDGTDEVYRAMGMIVNGATAGNLQLQWAQNVQQAASNTKVLTNSCLIATQLV